MRHAASKLSGRSLSDGAGERDARTTHLHLDLSVDPSSARSTFNAD